MKPGAPADQAISANYSSCTAGIHGGRCSRWGAAFPSVVIEALSGNLRETDDIGWYRDEHTVGALLTVMGRDSRAGHNRLRWRLEEIFRGRLESEESSSIRIQVYRHDEITKVDLPGSRDSQMVLL